MSRGLHPPLDFETEIRGHIDHYTESDNFVCFLCAFETQDAVEILNHLKDKHNFVLSDIKHTPLIPKYLEHWRFRPPPLVKIPNTQLETIDPDNEDERHLKMALHRMRLEKVMHEHEWERTCLQEPITCLFCADEFTGTWHGYLQWLFEKHTFNPGRPPNLVFIPELVELLRKELNANTCIFCKSVFPNQRKLKSHIRKKKHLRIPNDSMFDRFYMVNYLELDGDWQVGSDDEALEMEPLEAAAAEDFSDTEVNETVCLICEAVFPSPSDAIRHMKIVHGFDINELRKRMKYDFYNSVRFINYSRYMKSKHRCFICGCDVDGDYAQHISLHDEKIPDDLSRVIAEDQLLIPFIDGDPLLTELEDDIDCC